MRVARCVSEALRATCIVLLLGIPCHAQAREALVLEQTIEPFPGVVDGRGKLLMARGCPVKRTISILPDGKCRIQQEQWIAMEGGREALATIYHVYMPGKLYHWAKGCPVVFRSEGDPVGSLLAPKRLLQSAQLRRMPDILCHVLHVSVPWRWPKPDKNRVTLRVEGIPAGCDTTITVHDNPPRNWFAEITSENLVGETVMHAKGRWQPIDESVVLAAPKDVKFTGETREFAMALREFTKRQPFEKTRKRLSRAPLVIDRLPAVGDGAGWAEFRKKLPAIAEAKGPRED